MEHFLIDISDLERACTAKDYKIEQLETVIKAMHIKEIENEQKENELILN